MTITWLEIWSSPALGEPTEVKVWKLNIVRKCVNWTNIGLDHLAPLGSDSCDEAEHVHLPLGSHHVQHRIDYDEGARPPDTRTRRDRQKQRENDEIQNNTKTSKFQPSQVQ